MRVLNRPIQARYYSLEVGHLTFREIHVDMDPKPRPNQQRYLQVLRRMTPEQRLLKAIELSALVKQTFREGLRKRFPDLSETEFHQLFLKQLAKCHNQNY